MQIKPTHGAEGHLYAESRDGAYDRVDPYYVNLGGLLAFNPVLADLRRALGSEVEVEQPVMWGGPELDLHRTCERAWDIEEQVRIRLDMAGTTHVTNRGQEISDQRAAELLGISEPAFAQAAAQAVTGLRDGAAAMGSHEVEQPSTPSTEPAEVVNGRSPEQRLAAAQGRDLPSAGPAVAEGPRR
jgi:hypothetical protein